MKLGKKHAQELMKQVEEKYPVEKFSDTHYRVDEKIDIYPTTGTYVIKETNKSGKYEDLYSFLKEQFDKKEQIDYANPDIDKKVVSYLLRAKNIVGLMNIRVGRITEVATMIQTEEQNQASNNLAECALGRM